MHKTVINYCSFLNTKKTDKNCYMLNTRKTTEINRKHYIILKNTNIYDTKNYNKSLLSITYLSRYSNIHLDCYKNKKT